MAPTLTTPPDLLAGGRRHAHRPARRPRQGHGPRPLRRRLPHGGPARRPRAAKPARPRAHHLDRYVQGRALPGVKAVVTREDFADQPSEFIPAGEMMINYKDMVRNVLAREKVLYEGHPVAAVAATSTAIAKRALKLIEVKYEVLPHVIDVVEAMKPDAPLLHDDLFTVGVEPKPDKPSNVAKRIEIVLGDIEAGFAKADIIVEREFNTAPVHQGYIEPHATVASMAEDGSAEVWCSTQGHYIVRAHCARLLGMDIGKVRVDRLRDRRRLRRQDGRLPRAARAGAVEEGQAAR